MTTTETLADRLTTVTLAGTGVTVTAERTVCPYLVITPAMTDDGITNRLVLMHTLTGRMLPPMLGCDKSDLRKLAAAVAHLDWDFTDSHAFPPKTREGFIEARAELEFGESREKVSMDLPDGKPNPTWMALLTRQADTFGIVYLLAAIRRVAPETADHAAAWLAGQWAAGDSLGEWVWQWRHELQQGEPLHLPAVPSPPPTEGELL